MEYISAVEAAEKWGVSLRQVERLLAAGRIPGTIKHGRMWLLPYDVSKPYDLRLKDNIHQSLESVLFQLIAATSLSMPLDHPEEILNTVQEARVRRQYEALLAYLRGDFAGRTGEPYGIQIGESLLKDIPDVLGKPSVEPYIIRLMIPGKSAIKAALIILSLARGM